MSKLEQALQKADAQRKTGGSEPRVQAVDMDAAEYVTPGKGILVNEPNLRATREMDKLKIICSESTNTALLNEYRELRTSVFSRLDALNAVIMVTGVAPRSGASFVAMNLAASIGLNENRTSILVECNLTAPTFNKLLPAEYRGGLTDYLQSESLTLEDIIYPIGVERVRLIPAGKVRHAMEYFTSEKLRQLINEIRGRYSDRTVIVDAPAVASSADARILANLCDYSLLVVPYGEASEEAVAEAARAIGKDKFLGVVFNRVPE